MTTSTSGRTTVWAGVFPALCTPFAPDDSVDVAAARRVARFAVDAGAHGVVAFGLAGEVFKLSSAERKLLTDAILEEVAGAVPVLIGAVAESAGVAVELARYAEAAGADGIVAAPPVSAPGIDGDAVLDYLVAVAEQVTLPVMVQNAPAYLGVALSPALVREGRRRAGNIELVKLEAGPADMRRWIVELGEEFAVWGGDAGIYLLDCLRIGGAGVIPGVDLFDCLVGVFELASAGEDDAAARRFHQLLPTLAYEIQHSIDHFNACAKHVLVRRGVLSNARLRAPAASLDEPLLVDLLERYLTDLDLADVPVGAVS